MAERCANPIKFITPAVTPLMEDGSIDKASAGKLYESLIAGGMDGVLLFGSIGEFFGLTLDQKKELIPYAKEVIGDRMEIIVGTTSMIYTEIVDFSNYALECGVDGVMVIPPYYFHFDDESVFAYYDKLAEDIRGTLYLYNFPDRTGYSISPAVVRELAAKHDNIAGIKDTISGVDHTRELVKAVKPIRPDFKIYSGFDDNFAHNVLCGGNGCIAGLSNLYPTLASAWCKAAREKDFAKVQEIQQTVDSLMDIYNVGKPFVPFIKEAMALKGIIACPRATFPMPEASKEQKEALMAIMKRYEESGHVY